MIEKKIDKEEISEDTGTGIKLRKGFLSSALLFMYMIAEFYRDVWPLNDVDKPIIYILVALFIFVFVLNSIELPLLLKLATISLFTIMSTVMSHIVFFSEEKGIIPFFLIVFPAIVFLEQAEGEGFLKREFILEKKTSILVTSIISEIVLFIILNRFFDKPDVIYFSILVTTMVVLFIYGISLPVVYIAFEFLNKKIGAGLAIFLLVVLFVLGFVTVYLEWINNVFFGVIILLFIQLAITLFHELKAKQK